ncbi:unnamed protein product, partial [Ectocarpus sp. 13 AM-2016]
NTLLFDQPTQFAASTPLSDKPIRLAVWSGRDVDFHPATLFPLCTPGSPPFLKVVVFTGLLGVTPNEDALASVLGHEVGHVVANHAGEKLSK